MAPGDVNEPQHAFRFLDVDEKPQSMLPPIHDYENTPLVSLNKAIVSLTRIVPNVQHMVQTVKANCGGPEDGLTRDESNSIRLYSLEWQPSGKDIHRHSMYENEGEVLVPPVCQFNVVNSVDKGKGLHIIELNEIQSVFDFFNAFSPPINVSISHPTHNIQFHPISTVSLSKKSFPAALPNRCLEEHVVYLKQRSKVDLKRNELN
jgi:hypothetical protein